MFRKTHKYGDNIISADNYAPFFDFSADDGQFSPTVSAIMQACEKKESVICTDPKGELHARTADYLEKQGYQIVAKSVEV